MGLALRLAARARGRTSPNPMVGAVVVAGGTVVGTGYHRRAGGPHAEILALRRAGARAQGATLYVTLEPCTHTNKRTPPCAPAVLASGVRRVVVAMPDPNPHVRGRGVRALRRAGLQVDAGCLRAEAEALNEAYSHWIRTGRPFATLKAAISLDGKIATAAGESRWITSEAARRDVHRRRRGVDAIVVGIETVLRDDPELTVRVGRATAGDRQPLRVVLDSRLRIPPTARVLRPPARAAAGRLSPRNTLIVTTTRAPRRAVQTLRGLGVAVIPVPSRRGRVSLPACWRELGRRDVTNVLIEGGAEVNAAALEAGLVNRVCFYVAPVLLGGRDAKSAIGGAGARRLVRAWRLTAWRIRRLGPDLLIEGTLKK